MKTRKFETNVEAEVAAMIPERWLGNTYVWPPAAMAAALVDQMHVRA